MDDWQQQADQAARELLQIDQQILGAEIRLAIAEQELRNHDLQMENAKAADEFMRNKFTNRELYEWMVSQISAVFFQTYQLAYDIAKRAERSFRYELAAPTATFVDFGYWDSLKKGLLAGEKLHYDLKRMDLAYLDQNRREYEITKHISLMLHDPIALVKLKTTGDCFVNLPETIFDLDYPGHYMRRLKSVGVSIPCVTGPYTGVNCTLTLLRNSVRMSSSASGGYARTGTDDPRFADAVGAIQSVVTSNGQNDSGLFETNLKDERYLPFEGAGAISYWRLQLPQDTNNFDFDTVSDVIFHVRYTAREGGEALRTAVRTEVIAALPKLGVRAFRARMDFSNEWYRFIQPDAGASTRILRMDLSPDRFPFQFRQKNILVTKVDLLLDLKEGSAYNAPLTLSLKPPGDTEVAEPISLPRNPLFGNSPECQKSYPGGKPLGTWTLTGAQSALTQVALEDVILVCYYSVNPVS